MIVVGLLGVELVDRASGEPLPSITHSGKHYVVAQAGAEYKIRVTSFAGHPVVAEALIDGEKLHVVQKIHPGSKPRVFHGYPTTRDFTTYNAFKFGCPQIAEPGQVDGSAETGKICVLLFPAKKMEKLSASHKVRALKVASSAEQKMVQKAGQKFYQNVSLATGIGSSFEIGTVRTKKRWIGTKKRKSR